MMMVQDFGLVGKVSLQTQSKWQTWGFGMGKKASNSDEVRFCKILILDRFKNGPAYVIPPVLLFPHVHTTRRTDYLFLFSHPSHLQLAYYCVCPINCSQVPEINPTATILISIYTHY